VDSRIQVQLEEDGGGSTVQNFRWGTCLGFSRFIVPTLLSMSIIFFSPLADDGIAPPADVSNGVHNAGSDPAGSAIAFVAAPDPPSSDHSELDSRELLVTASFSMSARELRRIPRPWPPDAESVTVTAGGGSVCCDPHGRPGTNSLMSSTDDDDFPALKTTCNDYVFLGFWPDFTVGETVVTSESDFKSLFSTFMAIFLLKSHGHGIQFCGRKLTKFLLHSRPIRSSRSTVDQHVVL